jgi:hypothetical protein
MYIHNIIIVHTYNIIGGRTTDFNSIAPFYQILQFLTIFGGGYPLQGMLTIAVTFAFVGSLFDLFNFYVYQTNRGQ